MAEAMMWSEVSASSQSSSMKEVGGNERMRGISKVNGVLYKWTNFIYGWQKRYFEFEDGVLVYYKSVTEKHFGIRGSIAIKSAQVQVSGIDEYRFEVTTSGTSWYLRAGNRSARRSWLRAFRKYAEVCFVNNEEALNKQNNRLHDSSSIQLKKTKNLCPSMDNIAHGVTGKIGERKVFELKEKMRELEQFGDMISRQTAKLEEMFISFERNNDKVSVKALIDEGMSLKDITCAVFQNIRYCVDLLSIEHGNNEESSKKIDATSQLRDVGVSGTLLLLKNNHRQNHMDNILSDDEQEWHDANDVSSVASISTVKRNGSSHSAQFLSHNPLMKKLLIDRITLPTSNALYKEIECIFMEQLNYAKAGVQDKVWQLFSDEGTMKMYKRELEINGIVYDPLKATHLVEGVSAVEYIHYFFEPCYKAEWDDTLVSTRVIERICADTVLIHQIHKRIWPSAQRESLFWSHVRKLPDHKSSEALDLCMVCNHNCERFDVPLENGSNVRVGLTVAMLCETLVKEGSKMKDVKELTRDDVFCRICYCAQVNPGGWVPISALRIIYKREYPKFLRNFTKYVSDSVKCQPLIIK